MRTSCSPAFYVCVFLQANEPLAVSLLTIHNIHYMNKLMADLRRQIMADEI